MIASPDAGKLATMAYEAASLGYRVLTAVGRTELEELWKRQTAPIVVVDVRLTERQGANSPVPSFLLSDSVDRSEGLDELFASGRSSSRIKSDEFGIYLRRASSNDAHDEKQVLVALPEASPGSSRREDGVLRLWHLLRQRIPETAAHSQRVARLAARFGRELALEVTSQARLEQAALLHDIGKASLPREVLRKRESLDVPEWTLVQAHPVLGANLLRPLVRSQEVTLAVRHHHERFDGQGYPYGLEGEAIPFFARIIAVVDTFDAMTESRTYRGPISIDEALARVAQLGGSQFDPELAATFVAMMR
ncbi:HD-GYP domain-containing protein [Kolteria novifilia]